MAAAMTEADIQAAIVAHYRKTYAGRVIHVPNGGQRGKREAIRFKAIGVEAGCPDLIVFNPRGVFCVEVKTGTGKLSPSQEQFIDDLRDMLIDVAVVRSLDEAKMAFSAWKLATLEARERSEAELRTGF
jgi:hypothetical protein